MKLKLLSLLLAATVATASATTSYISSGVTSSVVHNSQSGLYTYSYNITPALFTEQDIFYFEVFFCEGAKILNASSNISFNGRLNINSYKFANLDYDDLEEDDDDDDDDTDMQLTFTFDSASAPELGDVSVKYGSTVSFMRADVPGCSVIPEPSVVGLSCLGLFLLLRRKR